ncbi:MAG: hypothetical protein JXJ22_11820 [Bacteroidales bacterium]|nr:hypothetical protein [Bacteroidales bacterium]
MNKKFHYEFDPATGILFKYYYGVISIEDLSSSWEYAFEKKLIPKEVKGFILDYRKATFNIKANEYKEIPKFYKKHIDIFRNFKIAIITQDPKDVVIPMLVKTEDDGYFSRPFSTIEAAVEWVLS